MGNTTNMRQSSSITDAVDQIGLYYSSLNDKISNPPTVKPEPKINKYTSYAPKVKNVQSVRKKGMVKWKVYCHIEQRYVEFYSNVYPTICPLHSHALLLKDVINTDFSQSIQHAPPQNTAGVENDAPPPYTAGVENGSSPPQYTS